MPYSWSTVLQHNAKVRESIRRQCEISDARLSRIRLSSGTRIVRYPEFKGAFDYVNNLYPYAHVKGALIYYATPNSLKDCGYNGAGGFYDTRQRIVVITDCIEVDDPAPFSVHAEYTLDEVLCHELIHYSANCKNPPSNRHVEEELAYGKSIDYLLSKGRTVDFVIEKNMMPYLTTCVDKVALMRQFLHKYYTWNTFAEMCPDEQEEFFTKHNEELATLWLSAAKEIGQKMVQAYSKLVKPVEVVPKKHTQNFLVIDDDI